MRVSLPALACAALALVGCGKDVVDTGDVENRIGESVSDQVKAPVKSVSCPDDVKARKGAVFDCIVTGGDGTRATVQVRQRDENGNVDYEAPLLHTGTAESVIEQGLSDRRDVELSTVDCPDIVVSKVGAKLTCKGIGDRKTYDIKVTQVDAQGSIRFRLVR
jgi:uncharacterized protein DUF4333